MPVIAAELAVNVSADTAQAEADLRRFSSQMAGGGGVFRGMFGADIATDIRRGLMGVGRSVIGIGTDAVSAGASFEYAMDQVTAVLGGTEAEAQRLNDTALALGMNPNLKVGVDEVAAGMYTLATAGITADQIIGGAMESTILLGNAAGASMDQSAEVTTKAMSIFKLGASDLGNVVDGAVGVLNASTYSLEDYAYFVANAGGTAAALGLSIDEMNQAAVVMAPSFSTGRTAATSFDAMLKGLSPTTAAAKDAMAALGMTTEDGANIFFDAAGDVVAFDDIYRNLVRTMGGLDAKTQMDMASAIFGEAGGAAAIALIRTTGDEYMRLQKIVGDTDALQQATIRTDNLNSKWDTFKDSIQSVKIAAFDAVKVPLTLAFEALMPAVSFLGPIVIGWAKSAGEWLTGVVTTFTVEILPAFEVGGFWPGVMAAIGTMSGGKVTVDAEAQVVNVDWGDFVYNYDATTGITEVDWGDFTYEYDARSKVSTVEWGDYQKVYDSESKINTVTWGNYTNSYDATSKIQDLDWGDFHYTYDALADVKTVGWGDFTWNYSAGTNVTSVTWGEYSHDYEGRVSIADVLWNYFTHTYDVMGWVKEMIWGVFTHIYDVMAWVKEMVWGSFFNTYDVGAEVASDPSWGGWSHTYNVSAKVTNVDWTTGGEGGGGGVGGFGGGGQATGTLSARGGLTWVGERGPELVALPGASRVWNNRESMAMAGAGGPQVVMYNSVADAIDIEVLARRVGQYLRMG